MEINIKGAEWYRGQVSAQFEQDIFVLFVGPYFDLFSKFDNWFEVGVVLFVRLDQSLDINLAQSRKRETNSGGEGVFGNRGHLGYRERNR